jgi:hypothetical protein
MTTLFFPILWWTVPPRDLARSQQSVGKFEAQSGGEVSQIDHDMSGGTSFDFFLESQGCHF